MYGVVLWSDDVDRKAVIWCEDHGDLAFCNDNAGDKTTAFEFDAGDLVQFDLICDRHLRYAHNPILVADSQFPNLVRGMRQTETMPAKANYMADVIAFPTTGGRHARPAA